MTRARPIAVFDSGVGGLTVFKALRRRLPREALAYFGDTAHVPYGTKSPDTVRRLASAHIRFLARRGVKCAVIACNTASAVALDAIRQAVRIPVIGVLDAGVRMALKTTHNLAEGAGSAAIAAAYKLRDGLAGQRVVCVMSGGNIDAAKLKWVLGS